MRTAVTVTLLLLILLGVGFLASRGEQTTTFLKDKIERGPSGEITVLILGRVAEGQGGKWHVAPNLTDAILVAQYLPEKNRIDLISLPRDLYVEFGGNEFKINEIYHRKKIEEFMAKLPEITGIEVKNYLVVDVEIIEAAVDNLGGIDVELTEPVVDPVSGFRLEPGVHHLDGESAIWVMRNRFAPEGDFFREKNQHNIIASVFEAFSALSTIEKTKFLLSMAPHIQETETNFSIGELAPQIAGIGALTFNSVTLDFTTGLLASSYVTVGTTTVVTEIDGAATTTATSLRAYILVPREGINNYGAIREFINAKLQ